MQNDAFFSTKTALTSWQINRFSLFLFSFTWFDALFMVLKQLMD